ncbi:ABC transporter ATP-binding protein [Paenibacillus sp. Leaf72]|uniref:ABC transporter ATP-binding protein n=1 Tax=Paenibacillus sp. Leaf72 TaxID=1736234 RepID=UPI0006FA4E33|nr:ABC transporter ATP-binding protein [Paenibacillus sp. Leaf72]KQO15320.1 hypothetical protein ASF12_27910 [Paenibacillus sp. Leaf72]
MTILKVDGLTKEYRNHKVVDEISFSLNKGEIFAFLGRNGAGKSTTINMLTGILKPTRGSIEIFDQPYEYLNRIKSRMGVLPDNSNYYNDMTALQHMFFFARIKGFGANKKAMLELLEEVGLGEHANKKVGKFSLGMKKKLGIAQALIGSPELLFLDEPTSTLDIESSIIIRDLIIKWASQGTTVFMTSHNLDEVERVCSRIAILHKGKIEKIGSMKELQQSHDEHVRLKIKYQSNTENEFQLWMNEMSQFAEIAAWNNEWVELNIANEGVIPHIVNGAVRYHLDLFRIEVEHTSLETIFVNHENKG